jgi:hypothetical protein
MSENEDPAATIARLLKNKLRVAKDSGVLAAVKVSGEWQSVDALKGFDGQVTVGVSECLDQKIELSGKVRRRMSTIKVNVWATDNPNVQENGKTTRAKIVEAVNSVIRQNRNKPNNATYDFTTPTVGEDDCKAYSGNSQASPISQSWIELSDAQRESLWYSDGQRHQVVSGENGEFASLLFRVKLDCRVQAVKSLVFTFEGYGLAPENAGFEVKVWSTLANAWQNAQTSQEGQEDEAKTLTLTSVLSSFVDADGYVWFLASTLAASNGESPAQLFCNYASCTLTINGITYCDVAGYRVLDRVDVKPFIYRTEFTLKSWFIENIGE